MVVLDMEKLMFQAVFEQAVEVAVQGLLEAQRHQTQAALAAMGLHLPYLVLP
jgi:hypothetical protein